MDGIAFGDFKRTKTRRGESYLMPHRKNNNNLQDQIILIEISRHFE